MDIYLAHALLSSLLERFEDDARLPNPRLTGLVSASDRRALQYLLQDSSSDPQAGPPVVSHLPAAEGEPHEQGQSGAAPDESVEPTSEPSEQSAAAPAVLECSLVETAFQRSKCEDQQIVLCLDFGTAKSKAFAATREQDPEFFELGLGKRDGDLDGSVYGVSSSVWIDESGQVFAGSQAVRRGMLRAAQGGPRRQRLDSIKQVLSQVTQEFDIGSRLLEQEVNPSGVELTYEDAISFYLAYLTDLALSELAGVY